MSVGRIAEVMQFQFAGDTARAQRYVPLARAQAGQLWASAGQLPFAKLPRRYANGVEIEITYHYGQWLARIFVPPVVPRPPGEVFDLFQGLVLPHTDYTTDPTYAQHTYESVEEEIDPRWFVIGRTPALFSVPGGRLTSREQGLTLGGNTDWRRPRDGKCVTWFGNNGRHIGPRFLTNKIYYKGQLATLTDPGTVCRAVGLIEHGETEYFVYVDEVDGLAFIKPFGVYGEDATGWTELAWASSIPGVYIPGSTTARQAFPVFFSPDGLRACAVLSDFVGSETSTALVEGVVDMVEQRITWTLLEVLSADTFGFQSVVTNSYQPGTSYTYTKDSELAACFGEVFPLAPALTTIEFTVCAGLSDDAIAAASQALGNSVTAWLADNPTWSVTVDTSGYAGSADVVLFDLDDPFNVNHCWRSNGPDWYRYVEVSNGASTRVGLAHVHYGHRLNVQWIDPYYRLAYQNVYTGRVHRFAEYNENNEIIVAYAELDGGETSDIENVITHPVEVWSGQLRGNPEGGFYISTGSDWGNTRHDLYYRTDWDQTQTDRAEYAHALTLPSDRVVPYAAVDSTIGGVNNFGYSRVYSLACNVGGDGTVSGNEIYREYEWTVNLRLQNTTRALIYIDLRGGISLWYEIELLTVSVGDYSQYDATAPFIGVGGGWDTVTPNVSSYSYSEADRVVLFHEDREVWSSAFSISSGGAPSAQPYLFDDTTPSSNTFTKVLPWNALASFGSYLGVNGGAASSWGGHFIASFHLDSNVDSTGDRAINVLYDGVSRKTYDIFELLNTNLAPGGAVVEPFNIAFFGDLKDIGAY